MVFAMGGSSSGAQSFTGTVPFVAAQSNSAPIPEGTQFKFVVTAVPTHGSTSSTTQITLDSSLASYVESKSIDPTTGELVDTVTMTLLKPLDPGNTLSVGVVVSAPNETYTKASKIQTYSSTSGPTLGEINKADCTQPNVTVQVNGTSGSEGGSYGG